MYTVSIIFSLTAFSHPLFVCENWLFLSFADISFLFCLSPSFYISLSPSFLSLSAPFFSLQSGSSFETIAKKLLAFFPNSQSHSSGSPSRLYTHSLHLLLNNELFALNIVCTRFVPSFNVNVFNCECEWSRAGDSKRHEKAYSETIGGKTTQNDRKSGSIAQKFCSL